MAEPKPQHLSPTSHEHDSFQKVLCPSQAAELHGASGKLSEMRIHPLLSAANFSEGLTDICVAGCAQPLHSASVPPS